MGKLRKVTHFCFAHIKQKVFREIKMSSNSPVRQVPKVREISDFPPPFSRKATPHSQIRSAKKTRTAVSLRFYKKIEIFSKIPPLHGGVCPARPPPLARLHPHSQDDPGGGLRGRKDSHGQQVRKFFSSWLCCFCYGC